MAPFARLAAGCEEDAGLREGLSRLEGAWLGYLTSVRRQNVGEGVAEEVEGEDEGSNDDAGH